MNQLLNNRTRLYFTVLSAAITIGIAGCGNKTNNTKNEGGRRVAYFKNMQSNIKGYLTEGFNPLDLGIVDRTDCFRFTYDKQDRVTEVAFVIKGRVEDSYTYQFAKRIFTYTDSSIIYSHFDKFGKKLPLSRSNGALYAFAKEVILRNNIPFSERGLDFNNQPLNDFAEKRFECDSLGRIVWEKNVNQFGRMLDITQREGIFYRRFEYTKNGLLKSTSFYEIQSEKRNLGGIHKVEYEYNKAGNIIKNSFLNENNELHAELGTGIAYRAMEYNKFGNMLKQALYGKQANLLNGASGYAIQKNEYDIYSNNLKTTYYDKGEKPTINKEIGAFGEQLTYDNRGDLVLSEFIDGSNKVMNSETLEYAYKAMEYNDSGLVISEAYFDKDNKATEFKGLGAHVKRSAYNEDGELIKTSFLNAQNELFMHPACNCASISFTHDSVGNVLEEVYLNLEGKPIQKGKNGITKRKYVYNQYGFMELIEYYDANGKEIVIEGNNYVQ